MKILVFCPTYRLESETVDAIFRQEWDDVMDVMFSRWNPPGNDRNVILWQYSRAEGLLKTRQYDALFCVESDVIPPPDALQKLVALEKDVANGLYMFRRGPPVANSIRYIEGCSWPDQSYSLIDQGREMATVWGKTIRVSGLGLGCSLIRRHVFESVHFRASDTTHCDWGFAADCLQRGYEMWCDMSVVCGHKKPDGEILWPTIDGYETTKGDASEDWHLEPARRGEELPV